MNLVKLFAWLALALMLIPVGLAGSVIDEYVWTNSPAVGYQHQPARLITPEDKVCLAKNIFFESRGQPTQGQVAVSWVVLNRVESPHFPNTICEVIYQGRHKPSWKDPSKRVPVRNRCQFSWYCDGKSDKINLNNSVVARAWDRSVAVAEVVLGEWEWGTKSPLGPITHYHADYVSPNWPRLKKHVKIGNHIFYVRR